MYSVMIVDDESTIRRGLLCFIDWQKLDCKVVYEASNGLEAKEYLMSNKIDIVITDIKMPGMDGIMLSEFIHENFTNIKIILLTAYADFSYAQAAIKYNVVDYVIKTNPTEKLPEVITKAKELIRQQNEKESKLKQLEKRMSDNLSEITEMFMKDIINGIIMDKELISGKTAELRLSLENYFVICYEINSIYHENIGVNFEEQNKFIFSFKNFLELAFKEQYHYNVIMNGNSLASIISFKENNFSLCIQSLLSTCTDVLNMADSFMKFSISIGISNIHHHMSEISCAYSEAQDALMKNFYNENNIYIYNHMKDEIKSHNPIETDKYNDEIIDKIQSADYAGAASTLSKLFQIYKEKKEPMEYVKVSSIFLISQCYRLLINNTLNSNDLVEHEAKLYKEIQNSKTIHNLFDTLDCFIKSVIELISSNENRYNHLIGEVNKFIRQNYYKEISLKYIADYIHINSSYLSRLYKKETGESVIDFINKFRIDKAKKLLKDPSNRVFEVANAVGIQDSAYFTHVFIKYVGISPKEYRIKHT